MIIESSAPSRVDLAGGTIDIPPLFLFHEGAATVNFAIDLKATCRLETRDDNKIILESIDRGVTFETDLDHFHELAHEPRLELLSKLVYFFKPETGLHMITEGKAPAGAGLAGSSTLNIAVVGALNHLVGNRYQPDQFIPIASSVETQVIKVPAGFQDYYSAQYGGVSCIHFRPDGFQREEIKTDTAMLESRIAVCYTGEPRNSGTNNWEITKRHIDGDPELFDIFEGIRDNSLELREALLANSWDNVGEIIKKSFPLRKRLSPNITTSHMDEMIEAAHANGAIGTKVCGAGGGGCIAFFCEDGKREDVEKALSAIEGCEVLNWNISPEGLTVKEV